MGAVKTKSKKLQLAKKIGIGILGGMAVIYIGTVSYYRFSMLKKIEVQNGEVIYKNAYSKRKDHIVKEVEITHKSEMYKVEDINFTLDGKTLDISNVYELNQRYYLPINELLEMLNIEFYQEGNIYKFNDVIVDLNDNKFIKNDILQSLRGDSIIEKGVRYISLNDVQNILGLADFWNYEDRVINLFTNEVSLTPKFDRTDLTGKAAMIRLEDVRPGDEYITNHGVLSMKATADYFYENSIKFHIAWIPRFKDPMNKIDNDLLVDRSMGNAQFINMLDYIIYRGGNIGLHGYTHQSGSYKSGVGSDLSAKFNASEEQTREIVEASIQTAQVLNIPYTFFESAHYHSTKKQQSIIEEYVDAVFEPYKIYWNLQPVVSKRNDSTIYVPTPIGYSETDDASDIVKKLEQRAGLNNVLTALFIHPTKEMKYFDFKIQEGELITIHKDDSPMQNIVEELNQQGQVTISINDLK